MKRFSRDQLHGAGHLLLLAGFVTFAIWYALDAYSAQSRIQNMLIIAPGAMLVLGLGLIFAASEIRLLITMHANRDASADSEAPVRGSFKQRYGTTSAAFALGIYVLIMPFIGFDIATVLFIAASMIMQGQRTWWKIAAFSLIAGLLPVWGLDALLAIEFPTLLL
jgi:putative tricarboxylic transport membrane protein